MNQKTNVEDGTLQAYALAGEGGGLRAAEDIFDVAQKNGNNGISASVDRVDTLSKIKTFFRFGGLGTLLLFVGLPTFLASVYFGLIASDRYVSHAKFIIRNAEQNSISALGAILQSSGLSSGQQDDSYVVVDFMISRDALRGLEETVNYSKLMGLEDADYFSRYPGFGEESFEDLFDYYENRVVASRDLSTGIVDLTVEAFRPEDAKLIAKTLLSLGEDLVNEMNKRAESDALSLARREVSRAEQRLKDNQVEFARYRLQKGLVSPEADTTALMTLIGELTGELSVAEAELSYLRQATPENPQINVLEKKTETLSHQIMRERSKLVGSDDSLSSSYGSFEKLMLEREFASKALLVAQTGLEQARAEASRKQLYLETIVAPNTPDKARQPKRFLAIVTVSVTSFLLYAIAWLLYVNAREHRK
ncbi:hypothetical protein [Desulfosediminicola sp.]|uniref:hypothetical protein n=1 Tax=Desulfosediminicola sp. TaxID=2886825 RepID=UPI003AF2FDD9